MALRDCHFKLLSPGNIGVWRLWTVLCWLFQLGFATGCKDPEHYQNIYIQIWSAITSHISDSSDSLTASIDEALNPDQNLWSIITDITCKCWLAKIRSSSTAIQMVCIWKDHQDRDLIWQRKLFGLSSWTWCFSRKFEMSSQHIVMRCFLFDEKLTRTAASAHCCSTAALVRVITLHKANLASWKMAPLASSSLAFQPECRI